jgi:hypothetical protein
VAIVPITLVLAGLGFRIGIVAGWEDSHKYWRFTDFTCLTVDDADLNPSVIDLHLLSPYMLASHTRFNLAFLPMPVVFTIL